MTLRVAIDYRRKIGKDDKYCKTLLYDRKGKSISISFALGA